MGNQQGSFSPEQIEQYQDCTFFTKKEITKLHARFRELDPDTIPWNMQTEQAMNLSLPPDVVTTMTELRENPFAERILEVFSEDSSGHITFNNFVDMFNVFSEHAPRDLKAFYAFKIYDMDNDGYISMDDLYNTLRCLTREELTKEEINLVVQKVLEESEMDDDCQISFMEFEHVISRAPDFLNTFHIRI